MSKKNRYYSDIKIIKGKRSRFFKILGVLFFCCLFVWFSYSISLILGKTINISGGLFKSGVKYYYALEFGKFQKLGDAQECAKNVVAIEGAGFVFEKENNYYVLGSLYLNEKDANNVINSNKTNEDIKIYKIGVDFNDFANDSNISNEIAIVIEDLYQNIIDYELGKLNHIGLASKINELDAECCVIKNKAKEDKCLNQLIKCEKVLNNLTSVVLNNEMVSSSIKYALIEIVSIISK